MTSQLHEARLRCLPVCCFAWRVQLVEEEEEEQVLSWLGCFVWLAVVTVFISILSDYIMDAITGRVLWGLLAG